MVESHENPSTPTPSAYGRIGPNRRTVLAPILTGGILVSLGAGTRLANATTPGTTGTDPGKAPGTDKGSDNSGNDLVVHDVRVFDGDQVLANATVLVVRGRVVAVGTFDRSSSGSVAGIAVPQSALRYDGRGHTLLPGLVDAHVHSDAEFRTEAPRFGVTTELDMFSDPDVLPAAKRQRGSLRRTSASDLWSAGVGLTVPGGHPQIEGWNYPALTENTDVDAFVEARVQEGSDYIKIIVEDGNGTLPSLTPAQVRSGVAAAHHRGKLALAHAERLAHVRTAVAAGVDGIVHVPIDRSMDDSLIADIHQSGIFVVPTVTVIDCGASADEALHDPATAPYLSELQQYTLANRPRPCRPKYHENAMANTKRLHEAGVPILAGTDAPLPGTANGISLLWAVEYLTESGLSPVAALRAATSEPARRLGLGDRGRIQPGYRADLLLVEGDPTTDIRRLRNIAFVRKNGFAIDRTPVSPES